MGYTLENAAQLRKIASKTLILSAKIDDDTKRFITNSNAIGTRCEEFWPKIQSSAQTSKKISDDAANVLGDYAKLMENVAQKMEDAIRSGNM